LLGTEALANVVPILAVVVEKNKGGGGTEEDNAGETGGEEVALDAGLGFVIARDLELAGADLDGHFGTLGAALTDGELVALVDDEGGDVHGGVFERFQVAFDGAHVAVALGDKGVVDVELRLAFVGLDGLKNRL
jgi:hypothetical protein